MDLLLTLGNPLRRCLEGVSVRLFWTRVVATLLLSACLLRASPGLGQSWTAQLPSAIARDVIWSADFEQGDLSAWTDRGFEHPGGGIFNTGGNDVSVNVVSDLVHSGNWAAHTEIRNAFRARNGHRAVRLMRWTNQPWDTGGEFFPDRAFYSVWLYLPHVYNPNKRRPWDPGDGGWWNIFQFKGKDRAGKSQPIWTLNIGYNVQHERMYLYLYSPQDRTRSSIESNRPRSLPAREWVHVEALYQAATGKQGTIKVWQNGVELLTAQQVKTSLGGRTGRDTSIVWGIGNYTDHVTGDPRGDGRAVIYFDDAIVSRSRVSQVLQQ